MTLSRRLFLAGIPAALCARPKRLSKDEDAFLEDMSHRAFRFFWEQADSKTGLVRDRALVDSEGPDKRTMASSAATGFGLTGLCIAAERRWLPRAEIRDRVFATLHFYADQSPQEHGWFYHFVDCATGERHRTTELSSIDTALLLAGVLTAGEYFHNDLEITRAARRIWERVDFKWMMNGNPTLLSMHWKPEDGFAPRFWDHHCELGIMYFLGIASPTSPMPLDSWYAWRRPTVTYAGYTYISGAPPLFVHQYSQGWIDFRGHREKRASGTDWFENSVLATRAHRQFCLDLHDKFPGYEDDIWGISASDSARGYRAWGGPPATNNIDGSVVPCAAGGSLMLAPDICVPALMAMKKKFGDRTYKRYSFVDAFHPTNGWTDKDVLGIDLGMTLISAENLRTGNVWRWFGRNPDVRRTMSALFT